MGVVLVRAANRHPPDHPGDPEPHCQDRRIQRRLARLGNTEVAGYAELLDLLLSSWQDIPFSENQIKQLHQILLRYSEKDAWHRGNLMTELVAWVNQEREKIVLAALPGLSLQIVESAREHGRVTIDAAIRLTGASRNTLKQHFRGLVERGTLSQHGSGRGVWYDLR